MSHSNARPNRVCVACEAPFYARPREARRRFCSRVCRQAHPELDETPAAQARPERPEENAQFRIHSRAEAIALIEAKLTAASESAALDRLTLDLLRRWPQIAARRDRGDRGDRGDRAS